MYPKLPNQNRALGNDTSGKCKVNISSLDHAILQGLVYPKLPNQNRALGNDTSGKCKVNISSLDHAIPHSLVYPKIQTSIVYLAMTHLENAG